MSVIDPGEGNTRTGDARTRDEPPASAREAEQDAADLGKSAVGSANQPGTQTDEAESRVQEAVEAAHEMADQSGGGMGRPIERAVSRTSVLSLVPRNPG